MTQSQKEKTNVAAASPTQAPVLCVGDTVVISKPKIINKENWFGWYPYMDKYDGQEAKVTNILERPYDEEIHAYDLDIDDGDTGWLEIWLTKVDA